jgi:PEP-CTERM motif-containing protein
MLRHRFFGFAAALMALCLGGVIARADVFTWVDLTDSVTFTHVGTDTTITSSPCISQENCILNLQRGNQTLLNEAVLFLAEDPLLNFVSDQVDFQDFGGPTMNFVSLDESQTLCAGLCQAQETGLPQLAFTISWSGGGSDTVFVQSDAEPGTGRTVPEPGTLILLMTALGGLGLARRRQMR